MMAWPVFCCCDCDRPPGARQVGRLVWAHIPRNPRAWHQHGIATDEGLSQFLISGRAEGQGTKRLRDERRSERKLRKLSQHDHSPPFPAQTTPLVLFSRSFLSGWPNEILKQKHLVCIKLPSAAFPQREGLVFPA